MVVLIKTIVVNFNQASYRVKEDDSSLNIIMELSQTSSVQFQVMISTVDVTAIGISLLSLLCTSL